MQMKMVMKMKIFKPIIAIFKLIYRLIDKFIVVPLSRLVYRINELLRNNSGKVERILNRPNVLIYVSLFLAIAVFILIDSKSIRLLSDQAEVLAGQKVNVIYNEEAYVVDGVPDKVDITLIGRKSDLYLAKQLGEHEVVLDLSDYKVGTYKVKMQYNHNIDSVDYKLDPSTITVKISKKISVEKDIEYDLLNEDKLSKKLSIKSVKLDRESIYVRGSEETLDKIAKVKALIDLKAANLTEKGTFTVDSILLVAYASDGTIIPNVEMAPNKINASVVVDSYYAELPVKVVTTGNIKSGHAISSLNSSVQKVGVYGDEEVIKKLQYIEAKIAVDEITKDTNTSVALEKPSGVRYMTEATTNVEIKVDQEISKEFEGISLEYSNLANGYTAGMGPGTDNTVIVIAKGVSSVLDAFDTTKIRATVDLSGLTAGTHEVEVKVASDDVRVQLIPKVKTVKIVIIKR